MQANKILMKAGDAALKPLHRSIGGISSATGTSAMKKTVNQQHLQLMVGTGITRALGTWVKNACELQGTRQFGCLTPENASTLGTVTSAQKVNSSISKKSVVSTEQKVENVSIRRAERRDTTSESSVAGFMYKTPKERLLEAVRSLASVQVMQGSPTSIDGIALGNGWGMSSNLDRMRPMRQGVTHNTQSMLHSSVSGTSGILGAPSGRMFSTSSLLCQKKDAKDCKKKGGSLPCLQSSGIVKQDKDKGGSNKICEKFCMPCCPPARDPPECVVAQKKRECKKLRAPRPAYSECKKDPMKPIKPCECLIQRLPPCGLGESKSSKAC